MISMLRTAVAGLVVAGSTLLGPTAPAGAAPVPRRPACTTTVTTVWQGRVQTRTTVTLCGTVLCTKVERITPNGKVRLVSDACTPPPPAVTNDRDQYPLVAA